MNEMNDQIYQLYIQKAPEVLFNECPKGYKKLRRGNNKQNHKKKGRK